MPSLDRLMFDRLTRRLGLSTTHGVQRAIRVVSIALVASVALFGSYYYWDRYVHLGDQSPLERDIQYMEEVIREHPQDPEARIVLAEYYLGKGMYGDALDQVAQVLSQYPDYEGALLISGVACVRLNQPEAALDPLMRFVSLRKDRPMAQEDTTLQAAYYFLGESYVNLDHHSQAIPVLEAALAINSTDADALYQLGLAYQAIDQSQTAVERYHQAVRFVPNFAEAYAGMVESYAILGQPYHLAYAQGMQAFCAGNYEAAQAHLESATQALPDFVPAFLGLGLTYEKAGDLEAALTATQRALELAPTDFAVRQACERIQATINRQR
jgi:tetratricopeptide (TPR) repeat protein